MEFKRSGKVVRLLSDTISIEHGLSIIENPKKGGMNYGEWLGSAAKLLLIMGGKLSTVKSLPKKFAKLLSEKRTAYPELKKQETSELLTVKANVEMMLGEDERKKEKGQIVNNAFLQ